MSYDARVFNVMIASPSDVASERSIVREVIYDWNAVHSERESIVLLPVGWESHTSPEMGDRAQAIINEQTVDKCDLLVGIFGTRLGTDTGKYPSGTIEEIEDHIKSGKPAMVYFSNQLGDSGNFEAEQYTELMKWKEYYRSRGLCESYDSDSDFKEKFSRQLQIKVNQHEIFQFRGEEIDSGLRLEQSESHIPQLSNEAKVLLKEASQDSYGYIVFEVTAYETAIRRSDSGFNGKNLISDQKSRVVARWRAALKELTTGNLLENTPMPESTTDQIIPFQIMPFQSSPFQIMPFQSSLFQITHRGYEVIDVLEMTR